MRRHYRRNNIESEIDICKLIEIIILTLQFFADLLGAFVLAREQKCDAKVDRYAIAMGESIQLSNAGNSRRFLGGP